jgi:hypothetical protein
MTTTAIREKLHNYISIADDKKIKAIYTLLEEQIKPVSHWSDDDDFVADLDERVRRYEAGIDPSFSLAEVKAELEKLDEQVLKGQAK